MKKGILMGILGLSAMLAACDCSKGESKAFSQDAEMRSVMENFIEGDVPSKAPLVKMREAELIRIVSLTVQQSGTLLAEEVATALTRGITPEEILEAVYQCAPYSGFPRVADAVEIVHSVFKAKGVKVEESRATVNEETRLQAGAEAQGKLFGPAFIEMAKAGKDAMPAINYFLASNCFGDYYTRKGLDLETRELLTMAMLVNLGTEPQLKAHIAANLKIRSAEYIEQAIYTCLPYCGYPRTLNALRLLKEAAAENGVTFRQAPGGSASSPTLISKDNIVSDSAEFAKQNKFGIGEPNVNYAKYFIGNSYLKSVTDAKSGFPMANVSFEPRCRNNWHIHHAKKGGGQVLIATAGSGWYQIEGQAPVSMNPGDAVVIPANVKHWHGAKKNSWFSHIAFEAPGESTSNEWLEPVSDEAYAAIHETDAPAKVTALKSSEEPKADKSITVNIRYTGKNGAARKFAEEMVASGTVAKIRAEKGNLRYEYHIPMDDPETVLLIDAWENQAAIDAHHATPMMKTIAALRDKYDLKMTVERYAPDNAMPKSDEKFIRK